MASFEQADAALNEAEEACGELKIRIEAYASAHKDPENVSRFSKAKEMLEALSLVAERYRRITNETDPVKQIYSKKRVDRCKKFLVQFKALSDVFSREISPIFDEEVKLLQKAEEKAVLEKERLLKRAEEEAVLAGRLQTLEEERHREACSKKKLEEQELLRKSIEAELEGLDKEKALQAVREKSTIEKLSALEQSLHSEEDEKAVFSESFRRMCVELDISDFKIVVGKLLELLTEICSDPGNLGFRVLRLRNESFYKAIASKPGSIAILSATGFRLKYSYEIEPILIELKAIPPKEDEVYLILEEPDALTRYDEWNLWLDRLKFIKEKMHQIYMKSRFYASGKSSSYGKEEFMADLQEISLSSASTNESYNQVQP